ncbi:MAG: pyruvate carboxylase, partial [Planctomycetales bacterium]|nr:pyruvate carboxylase [Planctomycetales bacterium]
IRVFRSAHELGIKTVAIYSHEDRFALHRFKADEAYQIGKAGEPIRAYLDIDGIIDIAKAHDVDVIHPGYGFLSENPELARACERAGITFCGPSPEILDKLGDKITARTIARAAGVPVLSGSNEPLKNADEALKLAEGLGYPVLLKAAKGGGGRGMRVVPKPEDLANALEQAQRESLNAFGSTDVFLEKFIQRPRHIEVQLMGDKHGRLVHLFERDCSLQRRHQKVVEIAPSPNLDERLRDEICQAALAVGHSVNYQSAGTVEFLVDSDTDKFYFIEVNPRIQVEHTCTEQVTGVDLIRSQILVAQGRTLADPLIGLPSQEKIRTNGYAIQCRVTTEDPLNKFLPDYGRLSHYRSSGGPGVRLDAGTAFSGAVVTPYYDSLLVKVITSGREFKEAAGRMERCLQEFRIRGVKTNIPFLINLVTHDRFLAGQCTTRFLDETPELFQFQPRKDRASKLFNYLAETIVNGNATVKGKLTAVRRDAAPVPALDHKQPLPKGTKDLLNELGPEKFSQWVLKQDRLLLTDTTMRDAHQSLLATRLRTYDMLAIAEHYARNHADLFSVEMWGGATFDTAMRYLRECPWQRLADLRAKMPNILTQMLLRASNALGYANYPDNLVKSFVQEATQAGMDVYRVFDSLNWLPNMKLAMESVVKSGAICEAAICYSGDILDKDKTKYDLKYYVELAKELEKMGAHILAIKDMAGLCKPYAAELLVKTLKQEIGIPIHFHTHDTSGVQAASIIKGAEQKLDIADAAFAPLSGLTSQPNLNSVVEALRFNKRDTKLDAEQLQRTAEYWEVVREYYAPFESTMKSSTADVYYNEMPGGQYTNLYEQAEAVGLGHRWHEITRMYAEVNQMLGDIVKVTPSSKAVGDMALYMIANNLTEADVLDERRDLSFPESVIDLLSGRMGQPPGGFPKAIQKRILRGEKPLKGRPGANLPPADFAAAAAELEKKTGRKPTQRDVVTYLIFPRVYSDFIAQQEQYGDLSVLPTPVFFYGPQLGEEVTVEIEQGKTLIVKLLTVGDPLADGYRNVFFELNGQQREASVRDKSQKAAVDHRPKADAANSNHVGAPMPGMVVNVAVKVGEQIAKGTKLLSLEAMKMETTLYAERDAKVAEVTVQAGSHVETGDLVVRFE